MPDRPVGNIEYYYSLMTDDELQTILEQIEWTSVISNEWKSENYIRKMIHKVMKKREEKRKDEKGDVGS